MPIETLHQTGHMVLELVTRDRWELSELSRRIDQFVQAIPPTANILVRATVVINGEGDLPGWRVQQTKVLRALYKHFEIGEKAYEHLRITKTSYYQWLRGTRIKEVTFEKLLERAPTPELKEMISALRHTYEIEGLFSARKRGRW